MDKKIIFIFVGLLLCFRLDFATGFFFNIFARNRNGAVPSYRRPVSRWSSWSAWSAPATNSCSDCWCQCSAFTFIDSYGRTQGNCRSASSGAAWCYVNKYAGNGYSYCMDQRRSQKYPGMTWSYQACSTPGLYDYRCQHCRGRRSRG